MNGQLLEIKLLGFRIYKVTHEETRGTTVSLEFETSSSLKSQNLILKS